MNFCLWIQLLGLLKAAWCRKNMSFGISQASGCGTRRRILSISFFICWIEEEGGESNAYFCGCLWKLNELSMKTTGPVLGIWKKHTTNVQFPLSSPTTILLPHILFYGFIHCSEILLLYNTLKTNTLVQKTIFLVPLHMAALWTALSVIFLSFCLNTLRHFFSPPSAPIITVCVHVCVLTDVIF